MMKRTALVLPTLSILAGILAMGLVSSPAAANSVSATLTLGAPTVTATEATIPVWLSFSGNAGDTIDNINLDVANSSPELTGGGFDFSRFSFAISPGLAGLGWTELIPVDFLGVETIVAGPSPLTPSATDYAVGTLQVDLSGLLGVFTVTLSPVDPTQGSDVGGLVGGDYVSYADSRILSLGNPEGVALVPEPLTASAVFLAVGTLGAYLRRRRAV
jgi:hypothetical protein